MNILHVINSVAVGGAETFLLRLIQNQESKGNTCFVLISYPNGNEIDYFDYWKNNSNVTFIYPYKESINLKMRILYKFNTLVKIFKKKGFLKGFLEKEKIAYYKRIIDKNKIDIVNSHLLGADFFTYENIVTTIPIPWILTSQGCYNDYDKVDLVEKVIPYINGMTYVADKNLTIFDRTNLKLTDNKKLIYNALPKSNGLNKELRINHGIDDTDFVIGQISRSIPEKGMEVAINAVNKLNNEGYSDIKLILCGPENDYYNELKNKYQSKTILFLGVVRDPLTYIPLFDVGILPSYFPSESCPSTIAEYLACSKPVISTNAGEIPKMIRDEQEQSAGIIIENKSKEDIPDYNLFAEAILEYYSDRQKLQNDSKIADLAAAKFDIEIAAREYDLIYKEAQKRILKIS